MLIVLGETLNGITMRLPEEEELHAYFYLTGFASFSICAFFKMLYFDVEERHPTWHAMHNRPAHRPAGWMLMHFLIIGAVAMFGSGCGMLLEVVAHWNATEIEHNQDVSDDTKQTLEDG